MQIELKDVKLDQNWVTPNALAIELGVACSTVTSWIHRNQIDYIVLPGAVIRRHLVDKRTAPAVRGPFGRPVKKAK